MNKFNRINNENARLFEDMLFDAQRNLFYARSVKEVRVLQHRINFLKDKVRQINGKSIR